MNGGMKLSYSIQRIIFVLFLVFPCIISCQSRGFSPVTYSAAQSGEAAEVAPAEGFIRSSDLMVALSPAVFGEGAVLSEITQPVIDGGG